MWSGIGGYFRSSDYFTCFVQKKKDVKCVGFLPRYAVRVCKNGPVNVLKCVLKK